MNSQSVPLRDYLIELESQMQEEETFKLLLQSALQDLSHEEAYQMWEKYDEA